MASTNNRSLGEGVIVKLRKDFAYIRDNRLGNIFFPRDAMLCDCDDLRKKFEEKDSVIYTASRQNPPQNDCNYIACSVSRKRDLTAIRGATIKEIFKTYAYAESSGYGKIFIPFSARNEYNKQWFGHEAAVGKKCTLMVLKQPTISECSYVAYAIGFGNAEQFIKNFLNSPCNSQPQQYFGYAEGQPETAPKQVGIIVIYNGPDKDAYVYSAQSGLARVSQANLSPLMKLGSFLQYDANKETAVDDLKCMWIAKNVMPVQAPQIKVLDGEEKKLSVDASAVVCRSTGTSKSAWLWNDYIGRIFMSGNNVHGLNPLRVVRVRAQYEGKFADVPWTAVDVKVIENEDEERALCSQLLMTEDYWKVSSVSRKDNGAVHGYVEHEDYGTAFFNWFDVTDQTSPQDGVLCRATFYRQYRNKNAPYRAVLVSMNDENNEPEEDHPLYSMSGELPFLRPLSPSSYWALFDNTPEEVAEVMEDGSVKSEPPLPSATVKSNTISSSDESDSASDPHGAFDVFQRSDISRKLSAQESLATNHVNTEKLSNSAGNIWGAACDGELLNQALLPNISHLLNNPLMPSDLFYTDNSYPASTPTTADAGVQTDPLREEKLLNDIISNHELLVKIITIFPEHAKSLVNLNWKN